MVNKSERKCVRYGNYMAEKKYEGTQVIEDMLNGNS